MDGREAPLRVALVSFEFPPAIAIGGIGTYAWEAAHMLAAAGHSVDVFTAGPPGRELANVAGLRVHRFDVADKEAFRRVIVPAFASLHAARAFDVLESPEVGFEGEGIAREFPQVPLVVRLHTPAFVLGKYSWDAPSAMDALRFTLGALRRGRYARLAPPAYDAASDPERLFTLRATEIASPSAAIGDELAQAWGLDRSRISLSPNGYQPAQDLLGLEPARSLRTVGFLGRLEPRKGVVELAAAIPLLLRQLPELRFRLIGPSWPFKKTDMESWMRATYPDSMHAVDFVGPIARDRLAEELSRCDAVVLPSRWESFGLVCAEAMSAGRAVVGSSAGGMAEIIVDGESGLLVPPYSPQGIAQAVLRLANDPGLVARLAQGGRARVLEHLGPRRVLPLQVRSYRRAIARAHGTVNA